MAVYVASRVDLICAFCGKLVPNPWTKYAGGPTSEMPALLQMIDTFPSVALAHLIPHQPRHHALDPLFANDGILCSLQGSIVFVVDALEGGRYLGLLCQEHVRLGSGHCGGWVWRTRVALVQRKSVCGGFGGRFAGAERQSSGQGVLRLQAGLGMANGWQQQHVTGP